jgi:D-glycero-alpha-D-manno-heptose-7-phosphate kinase
MVLSAAIKQYVHVVAQEAFFAGLTLKYSVVERIASSARIDDIKHPLFREALRMVPPEITPHGGWEFSSHADIPAGTGLGSSGAFTVALLATLCRINRQGEDATAIAGMACHIAMDVLQLPQGKQDEYISARGGLRKLVFRKNGHVEVDALRMSKTTEEALANGLTLCFTGCLHNNANATSLLRDQDSRTRAQDEAMLANLRATYANGIDSLAALRCGDLRGWAKLMDEHWQTKRDRSPGMSNPKIDELYAYAKDHGAIGAKLVGAGGGGFLLCFAEDSGRLRDAMQCQGVRTVDVAFDHTGVRVLEQ